MCVCVWQVWASKWNDRAWLSRKARGVADADLFMACLLQQVRHSTVNACALSLPAIISSWSLYFHILIQGSDVT